MKFLTEEWSVEQWREENKMQREVWRRIMPKLLAAFLFVYLLDIISVILRYLPR